MTSSLRTGIKWIWIVAIVSCLIYYLLAPSTFAKESIASFIAQHHNYSWAVYFLIHLLRGFIMLPSTPLIFAGIILFPENPFSVLTISLIGIMSSSLFIYYFSDKLGFSSFFNKKGTQIAHIEKHLSGKFGGLYITLWSFIPVVPTDLICYVSGALKIKIPVFLISIFVGELLLCALYIFGGLSLLS